MSELVGQGSKYTDDDRRRVAINYLITGNMTQVARITGIPRQTLSGWKQTDWWDELLSEVRHEKGEELDARMTKLIDTAFEQAQDRIENGDFRLTKEGKRVRVPMGGRDLVIAGATIYDKQRLHRSQPTAIKGHTSSIEELTKRFNELARRHKIRQVGLIDGECEEVE